VRAYGDCARKALQQAPVVKQEVLQKVLLIYDYDSIVIVMQCVDTFEARIISQDTGILLQMVCEINV
jgi:putative IMPACT (imprinted ancient) family translation regulator